MDVIKIKGRRSLAENMTRARQQLRDNPTISVYTMRPDGRENRRPYNMFCGIKLAMTNLGLAMTQVTDQFRVFGVLMEKSLREGRTWQ